jgi:hypothetical protein
MPAPIPCDAPVTMVVFGWPLTVVRLEDALFPEKDRCSSGSESDAVDHDFGFTEQDLGDLPGVVAFVLIVCLQAVDELRRFFKSTAGFVRVLELMLGQGEDAQVQGPGERVGVIS